MGGFFDGIVVHEILHWHPMVSSSYPVDSLTALQLNILWMAFFTRVPTSIGLGLLVLWRNAHKTHRWWSGKMLAGRMLTGFGAFNVVEGLVDHQLLGLHHVNERAPREQWIYWDRGFIIWGSGMLAISSLLFKQGQQ